MACLHCRVAYLGAVAGELAFLAVDLLFHGKTKPDRADRFVGTAAARTGDAGHCYGHLRLRLRQGAGHHGPHDGLADGTKLRNQRWCNAQLLGLGGVGVGDKAALKPLAGATQIRTGCRDETTRAAFCAAQHPAFL
jgi:hypothetical protein